jgi:hypothetical protein
MNRLFGALSIAGAIVGATAAPASADSWPAVTKTTAGASATCSVSSSTRYVHDDIGTITCSAIRDTEADGDSVYVAWKQDGYATISLYNSNGNGTSVSRTDSRFNPDGSFGTLKWRICRDQQAPFSDNCSSWQEYHPV